MHIDGSWVDISSLAIAALSGSVKPVRHVFRGTITSIEPTRIIVDFLSGASLVPFLLMIGAVISSDVLKTAMETSKIFMGLGGFAGVVLTVTEIWKI